MFALIPHSYKYVSPTRTMFEVLVEEMFSTMRLIILLASASNSSFMAMETG
jgi:hypothetical protein